MFNKRMQALIPAGAELVLFPDTDATTVINNSVYSQADVAPEVLGEWVQGDDYTFVVDHIDTPDETKIANTSGAINGVMSIVATGLISQGRTIRVAVNHEVYPKAVIVQAPKMRG